MVVLERADAQGLVLERGDATDDGVGGADGGDAGDAERNGVPADEGLVGAGAPAAGRVNDELHLVVLHLVEDVGPTTLLDLRQTLGLDARRVERLPRPFGA